MEQVSMALLDQVCTLYDQICSDIVSQQIYTLFILIIYIQLLYLVVDPRGLLVVLNRLRAQARVAPSRYLFGLFYV